MPADVAALLATALALVGALPQLRRLVVTGDASGVSLANATLGVVSELGWVAYTLQGSLWSAVPEAVLMAATNTLLAIALVRAGASSARPFGIAIAWCATLVVATVLGGWTLLGTVLPIAYGLQVAPAIWSAYRAWAPSGIAVTTWVLVLVESVLWASYGVDQGDQALTTFGAVGVAASTAILFRVLMTRDRFGHHIRPAGDHFGAAAEVNVPLPG